MPRFGCLLVLLVGAVAAPLAAQDPDVPPQSRIRLKQGPGSSWISGTLTRSSADSLYLTTENRETAVARDRITRLDMSVGRKPNTLGGLKTGAIAGTGVGALFGILLVSEDDGFFEFGAEVIPISMAGGAMLGAILGSGFGTLQRTDRWERVDVHAPAVTVVIARSPDGTRLGLSAQF